MADAEWHIMHARRVLRCPRDINEARSANAFNGMADMELLFKPQCMDESAGKCTAE